MPPHKGLGWAGEFSEPRLLLCPCPLPLGLWRGCRTELPTAPFPAPFSAQSASFCPSGQSAAREREVPHRASPVLWVCQGQKSPLPPPLMEMPSPSRPRVWPLKQCPSSLPPDPDFWIVFISVRPESSKESDLCSPQKPDLWQGCVWHKDVVSSPGEAQEAVLIWENLENSPCHGCKQGAA